MIRIERSPTEASRLPPFAIFARDFGGGHVLCYTRADGEAMFPCFGEVTRPIATLLPLPKLHGSKLYFLNLNEEAKLLACLAVEASDYYNRKRASDSFITIYLSDFRMYVATSKERASVLDICFLYRELSSVIASRTGVNVP